MPKSHIIRAGDSTESVAYNNGFFWETVWEYPANTELRKLRDDPNILEEGDVIVVPDKRQKKHPGATNKRHQFRRRGVPSVLRVRLLDQGKPRVGLAYTVAMGETEIQGATDGEGWLRCFLMPDVEKGRLTLETGEVYHFDIGSMRPTATRRGVQNRLRNLGYYSGPIDGQESDDLRDALERFQRRCELPVSGEADPDTLKALAQTHES